MRHIGTFLHWRSNCGTSMHAKMPGSSGEREREGGGGESWQWPPPNQSIQSSVTKHIYNKIHMNNRELEAPRASVHLRYYMKCDREETVRFNTA